MAFAASPSRASAPAREPDEIDGPRAGTERLRKTYQARTSFESSFAGAVAIPKGQIEYPSLVRTLLRNVYTDPAFVAAIAK